MPGEGEEIFTAPEPQPAPGGAPGAPFDGAQFADYDETKHKRDEGGKWATKEGTGVSEDEDKGAEKAPTKFKNHKAAEKAFESIGVEFVEMDASVDLEQAAIVHDAFATARDSGSEMPTLLMLVSNKDNWPGEFDAGQDMIRMNLDAGKRMQSDKSRKTDPTTGVRWYTGGQDASATAFHELGHLNHSRSVGLEKFYKDSVGYDLNTGEYADEDVFLPDDEMNVAMNEVSHYGSQNSAEFIAEVYGGIMAGEEFGPNVEAIYKKYGGAPIKGFGE